MQDNAISIDWTFGDFGADVDRPATPWPGCPFRGFRQVGDSLGLALVAGPRRNGHCDDQQIPARFGNAENVIWKSPIPGRGHGSPIVVAGRVVVATADVAQQIQSVLAYDLDTGKQLWTKEVNQGGFPEQNHPKNTEASTTLASDGERLYVTFYHHGQIQLTALDLEGQLVWQKTVVRPFNPKKYQYGYGPSPILYKNLVIVAAEHDGKSSALVAFDRRRGREVWRTPRPGDVTFSSPVVAHVAGRDQLLISGSKKVASYDPRNGGLLWEVPGTSETTCGTMVWDDHLVFASGGYPKSETIAVAADGSRDVAWKNNQKCYEQSMMLVDGYLYGLTDKGVLYCWRSQDGQEAWRQRLGGPVSASPIYAGGLIYWANERGRMYVFRPNPEKFDLVAENRIGDESFASPAVSGSRMLLRVAEGQPQRQEFLICIGQL